MKVKVLVTRKYFDTELNRKVQTGEVINASSLDRAEKIVKAGFGKVVKVENNPTKQVEEKKPEKKQAPKKQPAKTKKTTKKK